MIARAALGLVLTLTLTLTLAGCKAEAPEDSGPPDLSGFDPEAVTRAEAACTAEGGNWASGGSGGFLCITPTRDANQRCTTGRDCDGLCLARSMTCAPVKPLFGCHEVLGDSGVRATLCTD